MTTGHSEPTPGLSPLVSVEEVRLRLGAIFPPSFPDRALLVGKMAARVVFVFLYGGFVEGTQRHLRPSAIYFFTADQARQTTDAARLDWLKTAFKPGFRPPGKRWYADTSREPIRDDLIRARLVRMGIVGRKAEVATTSSSPIYFLRSAFARLFDSTLEADELESAIETWRSHHLAPATLQRMAIKATGILAGQGDLVIDMPDGARMRMTAGPSSNILKALIESYAPRCSIVLQCCGSASVIARLIRISSNWPPRRAFGSTPRSCFPT